jgi:hypothetical protein
MQDGAIGKGARRNDLEGLTQRLHVHAGKRPDSKRDGVNPGRLIAPRMHQGDL